MSKEAEQNTEQMTKFAAVVNKFNEHKQLLNQARQLRSESAASFVYLRDAQFPTTDQYDPYTILSAVSEAERRKFGQAIFSRVLNYLRLLAVKKLYPTNNLADQVIVLIQQNQLKSIQLVPAYLSCTPQGIEQLQTFKQLCFSDEALQSTPAEVFFPATSQSFHSQVQLEDVAKCVVNAHQINLVQDGNKLFLCDGQFLTNNQILEAKHKMLATSKEELFVLLARFCQQHEAVSQVHLLPDYLNDYVKYDQPEELPDYFVNLVNHKNPLQMVRVVLGMYPEKIEGEKMELPELPVWYAEKLQQMMYLREVEFGGEEVIGDGVVMKCPKTKEGIIQLCQLYE